VRSTLRRRHMTRAALAVLSALRVLAVLLGLELSGVAHAGTEVVELVASEAVRHADACPPDGPCNDCPPSCPNCHCSNAPTAVTSTALPAELVALVFVPTPTLRIGERTPSSPELPLPFRPPQSRFARS